MIQQLPLTLYQYDGDTHIEEHGQFCWTPYKFEIVKYQLKQLMDH